MLGVILGINDNQLLGDDLQLSGGSLPRDAGLYQASCKEIHGIIVIPRPPVVGRLGAIPVDGNINVGPVKPKTPRHDSNDRASAVIEDHRGAKNTFVAMEHAFPVRITEDNHGRGAGLCIRFADAPPEQWRHAPKLRHVWSNNAAMYLFRCPVVKIDDVPTAVRNDVLERLRLPAERRDFIEMVEIAVTL